MTRLGAIVRCDDGGLGNQCWEMYRHLEPERTLCVLTAHKTRGPCKLDRYDGLNVKAIPGIPTPEDARRFMRGLDVVFSCECLYLPEWMEIAKRVKCEVVVQANPEMWDGEASGARVVLPTEWEARRVPHEGILPVPIALDRFSDRARVRTEAKVFYHPAAPAMADRNGTGIVLAALAHVKAEVKVIVRGARERGAIASRPHRVPKNVELLELSRTDDPYFTAYPDADVLLLPRRYGGLCLPAQEAAALGMPALMTDLEPQRDWPHVERVPTTTHEAIQTKAGAFAAFSCDPRQVAKTIDRLAGDPAHVEKLSFAALQWARARSWKRLLPEYQEVLCRQR